MTNILASKTGGSVGARSSEKLITPKRRSKQSRISRNKLRKAGIESTSSLEAVRKSLLADPVAARKWLQELGYLTPGGNVTSRYSVSGKTRSS